MENPGFDPKEIASLKQKLSSTGATFEVVASAHRSDEYANFYFIGTYQGKEVIFDCGMYTLRLHHESEVYEIAEHEAAKHFPEFKPIAYEEDENGDMVALNDMDEEIGLFIAESIISMEEEEMVKVREHVDEDIHHNYGIGLDVALNVEEITEEVIAKFVKAFNEGTLALDDTLYSFEHSRNDS